jgi:hypothetical protein
MLNDSKDSKENEKGTDIYKDKSTNNEKVKFTPSLTSSKEEKTTEFTPKLTSDEPNKKRNSFTPSNELTKIEKSKNFISSLTTDSEKKTRDFSPTLKLEKDENKNFKPALNVKENLIPSDKLYNSISTLSPKFLDYVKYAKKIGKEKLPNSYPNRGTRITNKFKDWIKNYETDPILAKNILTQIKQINNRKNIPEMIKHEVVAT